MNHVNVPIPEGLDEDQVADLVGWLTQQAASAAPARLPLEDDPKWRSETTQRIKQGMAEIDSGQGVEGDPLREIAAKYGLVVDP